MSQRSNEGLGNLKFFEGCSQNQGETCFGNDFGSILGHSRMGPSHFSGALS